MTVGFFRFADHRMQMRELRNHARQRSYYLYAHQTTKVVIDFTVVVRCGGKCTASGCSITTTYQLYSAPRWLAVTRKGVATPWALSTDRIA